MRAGKISSLGLVAVLTGLVSGAGAAAELLPQVRELSPLLRHLAVAGVVALTAGVVVVPFGVLIDRAFVDLRRHICGAATGEQPPAFVGPRWLLPINHALTGALHQFRERERALRNQLRDLEVRHRVSEAERRQIEAVLHSLRDAVLVTDGFNEVVMANEAAAAVLGFALDGALHRPVDGLVGDRSLCQLIADVRANCGPNERRHVEHTLPGEGGVPGRVYDVAFSSVENHKHEVAGVVTILHDLTRERELSQLKTDFVSKASHELRTPLSSIRAYVEMLVDGEAHDEPTLQEFYKIIQNETDRLGRLIDNMLNISRIEAGIIQIDREHVDVKGLIQRAVGTIEPQAREKEIKVGTRIASVDLGVDGDADMLYQVVLNLLSNAVKYTPAGGRVNVAADSDNLTRSVVVSVSDTGFGIPPDALTKVFEKFYRVENYKRVAKGTGLGLSLCKHIVETVHHGQIGVESDLGLGSKFWFTIPMHYAGSKAA